VSVEDLISTGLALEMEGRQNLWSCGEIVLKKFVKFQHFASTALVIFGLILISGCVRTKSSAVIPLASKPAPLVYSCNDLPMHSVGRGQPRACNRDILTDCKARAKAGDVEAMLKLFFAYTDESLSVHDQGNIEMFCRAYGGSRGYRRNGQVLRKERIEANPTLAMKWLHSAAKTGNCNALATIRTVYTSGRHVIRSRVKGKNYLAQAEGLKCSWARMSRTYENLKFNPSKKAIASARKLAEAGNCHAQEYLSGSYEKGYIYARNTKSKTAKFYIIEHNLSKALFWGLIARDTGRPSNTQANFYGWQEACPRPNGAILDWKSEKNLPTDLYEKAEIAAENWQVGQNEPTLKSQPQKRHIPERVAERGIKPRAPSEHQEGNIKPDVIVSPGAGNLALPDEGEVVSNIPSWRPITLPKNAPLYRKTEKPDVTAAFNMAERYVWKVFAAISKRQLKTGRGLKLGSAVAVNPSTLLTNCHIVEGQKIIILKRKRELRVATVITGSSDRDTCVLSTLKANLNHAKGVRLYSSLEVGENVISVGSPSGLENTLGTGIISGLRQRKGQRLIQTTAEISPGSSGGGLFDLYGSLIGITTFLLKDAQALNFAISVEEFGID
jgi:serine protease Do